MIIRYGTVLSLIRLFLFLDLDIHSCPFGAVLLTAADPSYLSRYINEGSLEHGLTADCTRRRTATLNRGINSDSSRYAEFRRRELVLVIRSCVNRSPSRRSPPPPSMMLRLRLMRIWYFRCRTETSRVTLHDRMRGVLPGQLVINLVLMSERYK